MAVSAFSMGEDVNENRGSAVRPVPSFFVNKIYFPLENV